MADHEFETITFEVRDVIERTLSVAGPAMAEIVLDLAQPFAPKVSSKRLPDGRMVTAPLEDMTPFLSREELVDNMIVPMVESPDDTETPSAPGLVNARP